MATIKQTLLKAKRSIEWTYDKTFSVLENQAYRKDNGATGTRFGPAEGKANIPCRLSVQRLSNTADGEATKLQVVEKLFCRPDLEIKPGSRLLIGEVKYTATNAPFVYDTHQEVVVERGGWV